MNIEYVPNIINLEDIYIKNEQYIYKIIKILKIFKISINDFEEDIKLLEKLIRKSIEINKLDN